MKQLVLILFGPPGCGKGTQAENVVQQYGLLHISTGDLLRDEIAAQTDLGKEAKKHMDLGELVPDEVVMKMISEYIAANSDAPGFLFDGFPRTNAQAEFLTALLQEKLIELIGLITLDVPEDLLVERLVQRGIEKGRTDDTPEVIRDRLKTYATKTMPVLEYYTSIGKKIVSLDGVGHVKVVFARIVSALNEMM